MLPLKLKMCGFLSYLRETEIDFTKFGKKGLYLITGDTGAGKTTIFDAISYALYGKASGDNREVRLFRSKNATIDDPTYVELTFMSGGKKYTVRRNPEYEQRAKRGSGSSVCKAKIILTEYDGDREIVKELKSERKSDEKDPITKIVGIDSEKFRQLSMIAQGAFDQVITANTKQRTEILRAIFNTENYEKLQLELARTAEKYNNECTELLKSMKDRLLLASCSDESLFREKLEEQKALCSSREYTMPADEITELLRNIAVEDEELSAGIREQMDVLTKSITDKNREIGTAQEREEKRKKYAAAKLSLDAAEKLLPQRQAVFDAVSGNKEKAAELQTKKKLLEEKRPLYKNLSEHISQLDIIERNREVNKNELHLTLQRLEAQNKLLEKQKYELEELSEPERSLERLGFEMSENSKKRDKLREDIKLIKKYSTAAELCRQKENELRKTSALAGKLREKYTAVYEAYINEQAGYLAETLETGKPCPVCGSLAHPNKAVKMENAPSREDVDSSRKESAKADAKAAETAAQLRAANDNRDELKSMAEELSAEFFGEVRGIDELERVVMSEGLVLKEILEQQSKTAEILKSKIKRKQELDKEIPVTEKECEKLRQKHTDCNTALAVLEQQHKNEEYNIKQIRKSLPFETSRQLEIKINELDAGAKQLSQSYDAAEKALSDCRNDIGRYKAAVEAIGEVSAEAQDELIKRLETEAKELQAKNKRMNEELILLGGRINTNRTSLEYIEKHKAVLEEKREYYLQANELGCTANGKLTDGQDKLNLEVFAQAKYFEGILALSNVRLMKMSNNKYEFRRSEEALSKRGQFGLEIDVIDHDSATRRSVRSLSGGESFMASLSLALGFSDTIQTAVGGVQLDTIFIDEGFGTLDGKKLENTYGVFNELGTDGKCLVGIISHVDELKKRIPNRIVITKDTEGNSHALVQTDI